MGAGFADVKATEFGWSWRVFGHPATTSANHGAGPPSLYWRCYRLRSAHVPFQGFAAAGWKLPNKWSKHAKDGLNSGQMQYSACQMGPFQHVLVCQVLKFRNGILPAGHGPLALAMGATCGALKAQD